MGSGYHFNYDTNDVNRGRDTAKIAGFPRFLQRVVDRISQLPVESIRSSSPLDQITVNSYRPGQGIPPHVDTHDAFENAILSLSLSDSVVMVPDKKKRR